MRQAFDHTDDFMWIFRDIGSDSIYQWRTAEIEVKHSSLCMLTWYSRVGLRIYSVP